ncbi:hypothetical protein [Mobiluncus mulieris]|nr:hypothetical protein [Mobiluncus mulieris]
MRVTPAQVRSALVGAGSRGACPVARAVRGRFAGGSRAVRG